MTALCKDCGVNTTPCTGKRGCRHKGKWEWYMVQPAIWEKVGMALNGGFLCIGIMKKRSLSGAKILVPSA